MKIIYQLNQGYCDVFIDLILARSGVPIFLLRYSWMKCVEPVLHVGTRATCLYEHFTNFPYPLQHWKTRWQYQWQVCGNLDTYQHNLVKVTSGVSSSSVVSLELSLFVITSLIMLLYSVEHADSLSAISLKQLELLRNSREKKLKYLSKSESKTRGSTLESSSNKSVLAGSPAVCRWDMWDKVRLG